MILVISSWEILKCPPFVRVAFILPIRIQLRMVCAVTPRLSAASLIFTSRFFFSMFLHEIQKAMVTKKRAGGRANGKPGQEHEK
jgi:hypothetical protein